MSSIRTIKKDKQALLREVVDDCLSAMAIHPEKHEEIAKIIEKSLACYNSCLDKINAGKGQKKAYYTEILNSMLKCADEGFEQLRAIINAK